jgi:von Willebrand factor type A domain
MNNRSILSVFGVLALVACSAGSAPGSGTNNNTGSTGAGAGSSIGVGNGSSSGGSSANIKVSDDGGPNSGEVMNGECSNQSFDLQRKPAEILIVLDRSASMEDPPDGQPSGSASKWSLVVPGVNAVVTATDSAVSWGLKVFPEGEGSECVAGSVTNMVPVAIAAANAKAVTDAVTATTPKGNGTPTGAAINAAVTYLKTLTDPNPKFILLATDGDPSCSASGKDSTGARTYAVQAVTDAATAGFKTFVVGIATTKASATQALNDMAVAGQMARADSNPLATKYYLASTKDELVTSLQTITGQVASCTFDLKAKPPDPYNIAVHVNGMRAPNDMTKANGWDYTGSDQMHIQVYGSWCDQIKAANANTVNFVFGCPGQPPPA